MSKKPIIIAIDGAIGVGKSTTANLLKIILGEFNTQIAIEDISENLLDRFYKTIAEGKRSPFVYQKAILANRFIQHVNAIVEAERQKSEYVILDRTLVGDEVFNDITLNDQLGDSESYKAYMHDNGIYSNEYEIDYHFYITTSPTEMLKRIKARKREVEMKTNNEYFRKVLTKHDEKFLTMANVITIDSSDKTPKQVADWIVAILIQRQGKK